MWLPLGSTYILGEPEVQVFSVSVHTGLLGRDRQLGLPLAGFGCNLACLQQTHRAESKQINKNKNSSWEVRGHGGSGERAQWVTLHTRHTLSSLDPYNLPS